MFYTVKHGKLKNTLSQRIYKSIQMHNIHQYKGNQSITMITLA